MPKQRATWLAVAIGVLYLAAAVAAAGFAFRAAVTTVYPYEIELFETSDLYAANRLARGETIYGWPSSAHYPEPFYSYTPLLPAVSAVALRLVRAMHGTGTLCVMRALSLASSAAAGLFVFLAVRRANGRWWLALLAALLFYGPSPQYRMLNVARPEALALALFLASMFCVASPRRGVRWLFVPLALAAAMAKQPFAIFCLAGPIYLWGRSRREAVMQTTLLVAGMLVCMLALNAATHGSFWRDTITYQALSNNDALNQPLFGIEDTLQLFFGLLKGYLGASLAMLAVCAAHVRVKRKQWFEEGNLWLTGWIWCNLIGVGSLLQWGGSANRLNPAIAANCIVFAMALGSLMDGEWRLSKRVYALACLALPAVAVQTLYYSVLRDPPTPPSGAREEMAEIERLARSADGEVASEFALSAVQYARPDAVMHFMGMKPFLDPAGADQQAAFRSDVERGRFILVVTTEDHYLLPSETVEALERTYRDVRHCPHNRLVVYGRSAELGRRTTGNGAASVR